MSEDQIAAHVLQICHQTEGGQGFTLTEIVARISMERPDMVLGFSQAWGSLLRTKRIKILQAGDPFLYGVTQRDGS